MRLLARSERGEERHHGVRAAATAGLLCCAAVSGFAAQPPLHPGRYGGIQGSTDSRFDSAWINDQGVAVLGVRDGEVTYYDTEFFVPGTLWRKSVSSPAGVEDPTDGSTFFVQSVYPQTLTDSLGAIGVDRLDGMIVAAWSDWAPDDRDGALLRGRELWLREGWAVPDTAALPGYEWGQLSWADVSAQDGQVALSARVRPDWSDDFGISSIWAGRADDLELIAHQNLTDVPGVVGGRFDTFDNVQPAVNGAGVVAFASSFREPIGGNVYAIGDGLFVWTPGGGLELAVSAGDTLGGHVVSAIDDPTINAAGQIAFGIRPVSAFNDGHESLWLREPDGALRRVAEADMPAPGVPGMTLDNIGLRRADRLNYTRDSPVLDERGRVSFIGMLSDADGPKYDTGVWRDTDGTLEKVLATGDVLDFSPGADPTDLARLDRVHDLASSPDGLLAMSVAYDTIAGSNRAVILVGHNGDIVFVDTQLNVNAEHRLAARTSGTDGRGMAVNDAGQVTYLTRRREGENWFATVYTPDLYFRADAGGTHTWGQADRWTLGLAPTPVHNTFFAPDTDAALAGPDTDTDLGSITVGGGTGTAELSLQPGARLNGFVYVDADGVLTGTTDSPLLREDGELVEFGLLVVNRDGGRVAPDGPMNLWALRVNAGSTLALELDADDADPQAAALVQTHSTFTAGGTLELALTDGFAPTLGQRFPLVSSAFEVAGAFDALVLPALADGLGWELEFAAQTLAALVVGAGVPGDYNGNGLVEQGDLNLVLQSWGQEFGPSHPPPAGWVHEVPGGLVEQSALNRVLLNWGAASSPVGGDDAAAVPEPGVAVGLLGLGVVLRRRR